MTTVEDKVSTKSEQNGEAKKGAGRPDLTKEVRFTVSLPVVIPILALVGIGIVVLLFGLFLLSVPKEQAPAVALALGLNIMAAATFAASRSKLTALTMVELGVLVVYPVLLAVILVNLGAVPGTDEHGGAETAVASEAAAEAAPEPVEISAANLEFDTDELTLPADEEVTLVLNNQDAAPHNVSIYKDDSLDEDFFIGENAAADQTIEYEIPALAAGAYYFRCDVHPAMDGRVTVE